jgi:adenine/guanine phosphoribosyltransferase-like PRPP-binding protein
MMTGWHASGWRTSTRRAALPAAALIAASALRSSVRWPTPYRESAVSKIVGIEARGFILGGAVAIDLDCGFVAIRKPGASSRARSWYASHLRTTEPNTCSYGYNANR